jgi:ribosomal protein S18 acetylase RimI-like enzyme
MRSVPAPGFELDDDRDRIDVDAVHSFISEQSYWGRGRSRELVQRAIDGSMRVLGLYHGEDLVGFARAVSDGATLAYMADVYVLPAHRGHGLGVALVREMIESGPCRELHWMLHTADAQGLYAKLGFTDGPIRHPLMELPRRYDSRP